MQAHVHWGRGSGGMLQEHFTLWNWFWCVFRDFVVNKEIFVFGSTFNSKGEGKIRGRRVPPTPPKWSPANRQCNQCSLPQLVRWMYVYGDCGHRAHKFASRGMLEYYFNIWTKDPSLCNQQTAAPMQRMQHHLPITNLEFPLNSWQHSEYSRNSKLVMERWCCMCYAEAAVCWLRSFTLTKLHVGRVNCLCQSNVYLPEDQWSKSNCYQ